MRSGNETTRRPARDLGGPKEWPRATRSRVGPANCSRWVLVPMVAEK